MRALISLVLIAAMARCSGPGVIEEVVPEPPAQPELIPAGPAFDLLYFDDGGLFRQKTSSDTIERLIPSVTYLGFREVSPDGRHVVFAYTSEDSSHLSLYNTASRHLNRLHTTPGDVVYSVAWAPAGNSLAFGYYKEIRLDYSVGMGSGGLKTASTDGSKVRGVGCSVSKYAKHWLPNGNLIVGDGNNLYVVDAADCRTISSHDVRKKHFITYSPDGSRMAYIYRDLVYNRQERAYEPDSSLYIADYDGSNEIKLFEHRHHARNIAWSPDGKELSFDIQSQDNPAFRYVLVYNVATEKTAYLINPDQTVGVSNVNASWSPNGSNIAFDLVTPGGETYQKAVQSSLYMMVNVVATLPVGAGFDTTWGWADENTLVVLEPDGLNLFTIEENRSLSTSAGRQLVHASRVEG